MSAAVPSGSFAASVLGSTPNTVVLCVGCDRRYFSGVSKVGPMMRWVAEHSNTGISLPELPQFNSEVRCSCACSSENWRWRITHGCARVVAGQGAVH